MVKVRLPAEGKQNIVKLIKIGNAIAAVSTDKVFYFEKGKWHVSADSIKA